MKKEKNEKPVEAGGPAMAAVTSGVPISYVKLEPTPGDPTNTANASQFIPIDAAPGLDQSIEPKWAGAHTFLKGVGFAPAAGSPSQATLDLSGQSFAYSVVAGTTHDFLVGGKQVGRIDNPQNPGEDDSLVARKYVQDYVTEHGGGGGVQPGPPASKVELQSKDGSATTYMRSDATLALDPAISPDWTGNHAFDNQASFKGGIAFQDGASINTDPNGIAYDVDNGKIHEFYVGGSEVGRVDDPQNPREDDSLVARKYVQDYVAEHGGGGGLQPGAPTKKVELQSQDGSATTYMRSDATLALDQAITPEWTGTHTFDAGVSFGSHLAGTATDTSHHILLYDGSGKTGFTVTQSALNYLVTGGTHDFYADTKKVATIDDPTHPGSDDSLISRKYLQEFSKTNDASGSSQLVQPISRVKVQGGGSATLSLPVPDDTTPWSSYVKALFVVDGAGSCAVSFDGKGTTVNPSEISVDDKDVVELVYSYSDTCWYALPITQASGNGPPAKPLMDMVVSYGSPKIADRKGLDPANVVAVYGPSDVSFSITVDNGATIVDAAEGNRTFFKLDDGKAEFRIQMPPDSVDWETSVVVVPDMEQDGKEATLALLGKLVPVQRPAVFFPMQIPDPNLGYTFIESYGNTRNVPCDGVTESEIYVIADKSQASSVLMTIDGNATFDDNTKSTSVNIQTDGSAVGKVISTAPGTVAVTIQAPPGSNLPDTVKVYPTFVEPPDVA